MFSIMQLQIITDLMNIKIGVNFKLELYSRVIRNGVTAKSENYYKGRYCYERSKQNDHGWDQWYAKGETQTLEWTNMFVETCTLKREY